MSVFVCGAAAAAAALCDRTGAGRGRRPGSLDSTVDRRMSVCLCVYGEVRLQRFCQLICGSCFKQQLLVRHADSCCGC